MIRQKTFILASIILLVLVSCKIKDSSIGGENTNYIPYYLKVYEADSLFLENDYQNTYKILNNLFKKYEPLNMDIYYEYKTYIISKYNTGKKITLNEFTRLITNFGFNKNQIMSNQDLKALYLNFKISDNDYTILRTKYLNQIDLNLRKDMLIMKEQDQKYRTKRRTDKEIQLQIEIDSINTIKMIGIFENIGFPNKNRIGEFNIDNTSVNCNVILLHTKDSIRLNYFIPKIKEFVKQGIAPPELYANLIDQHLIYNNKEQFYGTYQNSNINNVTNLELNLRRKEIGLPNKEYTEWRTEKSLTPHHYKLLKEQLKSINN